MWLTTPSGDQLLDTARSSARGGWRARGFQSEFTGVTAIRLELLKRKFTKGGKTYRCAKDSEMVA